MATIKHFPTNPHLGRFWYAHPDQQIVPRQCNRGALWSLSTEKESGIVVVAKSKQEVDEAQLAQQLLPTPKDPVRIQASAIFERAQLCIFVNCLKTKINKKRPVLAHF